MMDFSNFNLMESLQIFDSFTSSQLYQDLGLIFLFFIAMTPSIMFIPDEVFMLPLLAFNVGWFSLLMAVVGGHFIGFLLLYYLGHHADRLVNAKGKEQAKAKHWLHKWKHFVFFIVPFTSVVGDLIMIYAGTQHIKLNNIWWILLPAVILRGIISVAMLYGLIAVPSLLANGFT